MKNKALLVPLAIVNLINEELGEWVFEKLEQARIEAKKEYGDLTRKEIQDINGRPVSRTVNEYAQAIYAAMFLDTGAFSTSEYMEVRSSVSYYFALDDWRHSKEVFYFSKEMQELLLPSDEDMELPTAVFERIPFHCFYIELENHPRFHGIIVKYEDDITCTDGKTSSPGMILTFIRRGPEKDGLDLNYGFFSIPFAEAKTLKAIIEADNAVKNKLIKETNANVKNLESGILPNDVLAAMNLITYICCDNAEIRESQGTKQTRKPSPDGIILDRYSEVRKWNVGETITRSIKLNKKEEQKSKKGTSNFISLRKRAHVRAAHWHHYWVGPKDPSKETSENKRHLIVHWIPPTYINVETSEVNELPVKITKYE